MGILNVTPDSFSDGGRFVSVDSALRHAGEMADAGADILDVGGESTRPGARPVGEQEELDRVVPVIDALHARIPITLSVDTSKPAVMRAAVAAGAGLINDVWALRAEGALAAAREAGVPVCLMHMQGAPRSMQHAPRYGDVVEEVRGFLHARVAACVEAGIPRARLILDPGFGFGKTPRHNLRLLRDLDRITDLGPPVLVGLSRKSLLGELLGAPVDRRLYGSLALAVLALVGGASILRVHDVAATREVVTVTRAVLQEGE